MGWGAACVCLVPCMQYYYTALMYAADEGYPDVVAALLEKGVNIDVNVHDTVRR